MARTRSDAQRDSWFDASSSARRSAQVLCAVARSVLGGARGAGVTLDRCCDEALLVVERWCRGEASDLEVRDAARAVMLRSAEVMPLDASGRWRRRACDAVLRACDEVGAAPEGGVRERPSQLCVG